MKKPTPGKIVVLCTLALLIGVLAMGLASYKLNAVAGRDDSIAAVQKTGTIPQSTEELEKVTRQMLGAEAPTPNAANLNEIAPAAGK